MGLASLGAWAWSGLIWFVECGLRLGFGQSLEFRASLSQCPDVGLKVSGSEFRVSAMGFRV